MADHHRRGTHASESAGRQENPLRPWRRHRPVKLRATSQAALETWSPAADKAPAWQQLDEAYRLELQSRAYELAMERELNAAFAHDAELPERHLMKVRTNQQRHELAEASADTRRADRFATLRREHPDALPRGRGVGLPWRLPFELEWEKAARGVDGRAMPWGDEPEPAYCNLRGSLEGPPRVVEVDRFPTDVSVYGIRGLGGNTADWCADAYTPEGPVIAGDRVVLDEGAPDPRFRNVRGGSWRDGPEAVRSASRWRAQPDERSGRIGLRLARSVE